MKLRGINFGNVLCASGALGQAGEGYPHHWLLKLLGLDYTGMTLVAKTTTLEAREGNMPLKKNGITPKEFRPRCILPNFHYGNIKLSWRMFRLAIMLNSVSLTGPGLKFLLDTGRWQNLVDPFLISLMSVEPTPEARMNELVKSVELLAQYLPEFRAKVGLQINFSCPNVGLNPDELVDEARAAIKYAGVLGIPLMPKFNVLVPAKAVKAISDDANCDAICISNTIPWGKLPGRINWKKLFGSDISPLPVGFGGGGLSGAPLLELVIDWLCQAQCAGIKKPINAGGGILCPNDVDRLYNMGANSIFIGSAINLRPWRVQEIIERANELFGKGER